MDGCGAERPTLWRECRREAQSVVRRRREDCSKRGRDVAMNPPVARVPDSNTVSRIQRACFHLTHFTL